MTPPVRPEFDPTQLDATVKALKAQGAPDEAIHAYLQEHVGLKPVNGAFATDATAGSRAAGLSGPTAQHDFHAEYKSGALGQRMASENATEQGNEAPTGPMTPGGALATSFANNARGIPIVAGAQNVARAVVRGEPYTQAKSEIDNATHQIPAGLSRMQRMVGAAPLASVLPSGAVAGGATVGALDAAFSDNPNESLGDRAGNAVGGGIAGALSGKMLGSAGNAATRSGLTDAVASQLPKLGGKFASIGESLGLRGAGNRLLGDRQSVLDDLSGSEQSAAQTMLDHVNSYKQQAKQLYDAAKQDNGVINNPRVQQILANPQIKQLFEIARGRLGLGPNETVIQAAAPEVPRLAAGAGPSPAAIAGNGASVARVPSRQWQSTPVGSYADAMKDYLDESLLPGTFKPTPRANGTAPLGLAPGAQPSSHQSLSDALDAFRTRSGEAARRAQGGVAPNDNPFSSQMAGETNAQRVMREALERRSAESSLPSQPAKAVPATLNANPKAAVPEITADLPTPEELAMTKRLANQVVQAKFNAPTGLNSAEAAQLAPLLDELRGALHDASPAWKQADTFYSHAKNFETAYQKAYGAQQRTTASGLDPSKLKTPDAINAWVARASGTTVGVARASGQQAGAAGRLGEALRNAPLGTDIGETLRGANGVFQPSETAAAIRRPAFGSDEAAQRFGGLVGDLNAKGAKDAASFGPDRMKPSLNPLTLFGAGTKQNPLATPEGGALRSRLATALADPKQATALRAQLGRSREGAQMLELLSKVGLSAGNAAAGGP
jgi:hypothetical protein